MKNIYFDNRKDTVTILKRYIFDRKEYVDIMCKGKTWNSQSGKLYII